ncbi:MAG: leucyl aminopeptidase [Novosphingobium sp.]
MRIDIAVAPQTPAPRFIARLAGSDAMPDGIEPVLSAGAKTARFTGKAGQIHEGFVERGGDVVRVALVGTGEANGSAKGGGRMGSLEKAGAALAARYLTSGESALTIDLAGAGLSGAETAAFLLGMRLRAWRHDAYRTKLPDDQKVSLTSVTVTNAPDGAAAEWARESALADGVEFTRELVTEPGNVIYPESFVARCEARLAASGLVMRVLGEDEMRTLGMGALLGVSQGSPRPPRVLAIVWNGSTQGAKPMAFVGKGVTFDSGGISLKPPAGMEDMKWDMGGAGAVAGAMLAIAGRKAKANVIGICGLVENMPDGLAQRPGDVVISMSGQTIEVINTDAEGRLVLCDVLTWVQKEYAPSAIVDLATLTGAIIASLANEYAGIFANDDGLADKLIAAGNGCGEKLWRMPMGSAYDKLIDSPIADMKNVGPRNGGSITAAQFIKRFINNGTPWAHLDIAGVVWADKAGATWGKGATGYGVRLIDRYVRDNCEG